MFLSFFSSPSLLLYAQAACLENKQVKKHHARFSTNVKHWVIIWFFSCYSEGTCLLQGNIRLKESEPIRMEKPGWYFIQNYLIYVIWEWNGREKQNTYFCNCSLNKHLKKFLPWVFIIRGQDQSGAVSDPFLCYLWELRWTWLCWSKPLWTVASVFYSDLTGGSPCGCGLL